MYWADKIAKEIIDSGKYKPYWLDDLFTPSGAAHIGSLRGPIIHDLISRSLIDAGQKTTFSYVFNDFDPIDGLPEDLQEKFSKFLGFPLKTVPSPDDEFDNFADYFANDYKKVLEDLGVKVKYFSSWDMYHEGKFDEAIKIALDNAQAIQDIYMEVSGSQKKQQGWYPFQVICQNCSRLGTTRVYDWDGEKVSYKCEEAIVSWAKGCSNEGKVSPFGGTGKLPWKVDWPAHWKVLGVTIEGEGKDHSSRGGSRDIARELCKKVFKIAEPFDIPYEFFQLGGKKMSSSKGIGLKAHDLVKLLPNEVGRFLFCRTDFRSAIDFDPVGTMAIPDLFDEYDRCYRAYIDDTDEDLSRVFELSQIDKLSPKEKTFIPRFRDVVNFMQQSGLDLEKKFGEIKANSLNDTEKKILDERKKYAQIWLKEYALEEFNLQMSKDLPEVANNLSDDQKKFLKDIIPFLDQEDPEELQLKIYNLSKQLKIDSKEAFTAIYLSMIGKTHGPKAAWFLLSYSKEKVIERLKEASK